MLNRYKVTAALPAKYRLSSLPSMLYVDVLSGLVFQPETVIAVAVLDAIGRI
jgi:hypothetical protein